eukprot:CAMPEP_0172580152 /NCGR_PEP_ID=MMETSP1067-20121228/139613_1 /TAXON_ID=265564 ORGANISM="Thalassiosira punctigera, Strain Tpunct2005C2" /NCGR_SAMPLE_ID=MMETSP1067 /ASSEMBLY_ACC=CAM_ASM_000444 /LENGTH=430 /DNA_ID=CAMNT_0013372889 /DNA_START=33 /DNA_END=1322 /DNA_ORIENTATION=-
MLAKYRIAISIATVAVAACCLLPSPALSFLPPVGNMDRRSLYGSDISLFAVSSEIENEGHTPSPTSEETTTTKPHRRRVRYSGRYPRNFKDRYKERGGDKETILKVLAKGMTPAGTHVPIMVKECLQYMGLSGDGLQADECAKRRTKLVIDCTLGYGGHSSYILKHLVANGGMGDGSRLIAFDRDSAEIKKTEERLQSALSEMIGERLDHADHLLTTVNQNFQTLGIYLSSVNQTGKVTSLLADLGLSSMQIDDNDRGFTYKRSGPLDMRMNPDENTMTAYDLLRHLRVRKLKSMLRENSDEEFAAEIAVGLIGKGAKIPETTTELADRVRELAGPLIEEQSNKDGRRAGKKHAAMLKKKQLDSTVARVMQAIRIQVNGEFDALETLLEDVPNILAPGGRAVFLTFHSGEDRRVKKSFKEGFKRGVYSAW